MHLTSICAHSFARNWQLSFLNQRKGENERRKYFMINLHERMLPGPAEIEPVASWSPVERASYWAMDTGFVLAESTRWRIGSAKTISPHKLYLHTTPVTFLLCTWVFLFLFLPQSELLSRKKKKKQKKKKTKHSADIAHGTVWQAFRTMLSTLSRVGYWSLRKCILNRIKVYV